MWSVQAAVQAFRPFLCPLPLPSESATWAALPRRPSYRTARREVSAALGEIRDKRMAKAMKVGVTLIGHIRNLRRFQVTADHLCRPLNPCPRPELRVQRYRGAARKPELKLGGNVLAERQRCPFSVLFGASFNGHGRFA